MVNLLFSCFPLLPSKWFERRKKPSASSNNALLPFRTPLEDYYGADDVPHRPGNNQLVPLLLNEEARIVCLVGRKGAGKSVLLQAAAQSGSWMDHPARKEYLKPAMKNFVIHVARQVLANALVNRSLEIESYPQVVQEAFTNLIRPLHPHAVDPENLVLLFEFQVFANLLHESQTELQQIDGFANAREILLSHFPVMLFCDPNFIPSKRELQLCRPPTTTFCESNVSNRFLIVDAPGPLFENGNIFHDYALQFPKRTTSVFTVGLHGIRNRLEFERNLFKRAFELAYDRGIRQFGLVLTQVDVFRQGSEDICQIVDAILAMVQVESVARPQVRVKISLCSGLDEVSGKVAMEEMAKEKSNFFLDVKDPFLANGIIAHIDEKCSRQMSCQVLWTRSVYAGIGSISVLSNLKWHPSLFHLLSADDRMMVKQLFLGAGQGKCMLHSLPQSALNHIASFVVSSFSC